MSIFSHGFRREQKQLLEEAWLAAIDNRPFTAERLLITAALKRLDKRLRTKIEEAHKLLEMKSNDGFFEHKKYDINEKVVGKRLKRRNPLSDTSKNVFHACDVGGLYRENAVDMDTLPEIDQIHSFIQSKGFIGRLSSTGGKLTAVKKPFFNRWEGSPLCFETPIRIELSTIPASVTLSLTRN